MKSNNCVNCRYFTYKAKKADLVGFCLYKDKTVDDLNACKNFQEEGVSLGM